MISEETSTEAVLTGKTYGGEDIQGEDSIRVWNALKRLDLLVVVDFFMTPTAELTDLVLLAKTWLERDECCDELKIVIEIVKRMPRASREVVQWNDIDEYNNWKVGGMGIAFDDFKKKGYIVAPVSCKKYEEKGFDTPSGKVELNSTIFEKLGYDPLPDYKEPPESPISTPEILKEYPLILITGGRCYVGGSSSRRNMRLGSD